MRRIAWTTIATCLLGGCATGLPLNPDVVVSGQKYVAVSGEADVVVRSFLVDPAGERQEVGGARCTLTTSLYDATLVTPVRMRLPNFGPQSPVLNLVCTANGLKGAAQQPIATYWRTAPNAGPWYGPGWGPGWYGSPWYGPGWGPSFPVWEYPEVGVELR